MPGALLVADPMLQTPNDYNAKVYAQLLRLGTFNSFLPSLAGLSQLGRIEVSRGASMLDGGQKVSPTKSKYGPCSNWAKTHPWQ